ncbi:MAG: class I SAM-dependent methyltransferase [Myxococcota bacterium]|jgi:ubiquinone/menaquinone biosynthesis C-methylase UbiE|nr:class I SAM-dependent methyltransferase [Myxococcota bacterium]
MQRVPEPELMEGEEQARAYAEADYGDAHRAIAEGFLERFPLSMRQGSLLDLGCGPAEISLYIAQASPDLTVVGVDGSEAMLSHGRRAVDAQGLGSRVTLVQGYLPGAALPQGNFSLLFSNSLLHHMADPRVLWQEIARLGAPGAGVFVADLHRPEDDATLFELVETHSQGAPPVLKRDFVNSLRAAYTVHEVQEQLEQCALGHLRVHRTSDRHLRVEGVI